MGTLQRVAAACFLVDPVALLAGLEREEREARRTYWTAGFAVFGSWSAGGILGASGVAQLSNMEDLGLDVALPALLLALLANGIRERKNLLAAIAGAGITLCLLPLISAGAAVLLASLGALAPLAPGVRRRAASKVKRRSSVTKDRQ